MIDYDYVNKLTEREKDWLNKFTEEYVNASFKKEPGRNLHRTKAMKKNCYDRNNARNRCRYTQQKAMGVLNYIDELVEKKTGSEEEFLDSLDKKLGFVNDEEV